jgi:hypothetical protein
MSGRRNKTKLRQVLDTTTPGAGIFTAVASGILTIVAWGPGASGSSAVGGATPGGNAGGAVYKRIRLTKGQTISYLVGSAGASVTGANGNSATDTTIALPNGNQLIAQGGLALGVSTLSTGIGGDLNRKGGKGGNPSPAPGSPGEDGSPGGAPATNGSGGGGAAGFDSIIAGFAVSPGGNSNNSMALGYGAGSGGNDAGGPTASGGPGRVYMMLLVDPN